MPIIKYKSYRAEIQFLNQLHGGIPKDPEVIKTWLETKGISDADILRKTCEAMGVDAEGVDDATQKTIDKSAMGFKIGERGLYIEARMVKSAFKEAANVNREFLRAHNSKLAMARARCAERVWVRGVDDVEKIWLGREDPDGVEQRFVHLKDRFGNPVSAIKLVDYVNAPRLEFVIEVIDDNLFTEEVLRDLLEYMGRNGLGANRSQGAGLFELVSFAEEDGDG